MVNISVTRWSKFRTIIEIRTLGVPIYVRDYEEDIADNPEIGVALMDFIDKNHIDLSAPITMYDYRVINNDIVTNMSLSEIKEFTTEYTKAKGH